VTHEADLGVKKFAILFINNYIRRYRILKSIVSDYNLYFERAFWDGFTKTLGTKLRFSSLIYFQSNILAEKQIREYNYSCIGM
jgi:hypothetical protein